VALVVQELLSLPDDLTSPPMCTGIRVDVMVRNTTNSIMHDKTDQKPNLKIVESDVRTV
jgi:hypothetical protein